MEYLYQGTISTNKHWPSEKAPHMMNMFPAAGFTRWYVKEGKGTRFFWRRRSAFHVMAAFSRDDQRQIKISWTNGRPRYNTAQCDPFPCQLILSGVTGALRNADPGTHNANSPQKVAQNLGLRDTARSTAAHGGLERMLRAD